MADEYFPLLDAEEGNEVSWYKAGAAGIASGVLKVPEGVFSLAAELIDLGADTDTAASVEAFFDKLNPFEEIAEKHGAGKLTEALVQIGIPGAYGFKLGSKLAGSYMDARKAGKLMQLGKNQASKNWFKKGELAKKLNNQAGYVKFAAGTLGGATGETFVADIEKIGSFGDLFDAGPTQLDTWATEGREDAARKLMNRIKFGSESLLITPFVGGAGKTIKALGSKGKDWAYSDSEVARWMNKHIIEPLRPEGPLTKAVFGSQRVMEGFRAADTNRATELVKNLTRTIDKAFPQMQKVLDKTLSPKEKNSFLDEVNEMIFDGDMTKVFNNNKIKQFTTALRNKGINKETSDEIINVLTDARTDFAHLLNTVGKYKGQGDLVKILKERIKNYTGNTYRIFEDAPILGFFGRYRPTGEVKEAAANFFKGLIRRENPKMATSTAEQESRQLVNRILEDGVKVRKSSKGLPDPSYIKKTVEDLGYEKFYDDLVDGTGAPVKQIKNLLGEIKDPKYSIFNAITELSGMARMSSMLDEMKITNDQIKKLDPSKGSFWASKNEALKATNGVVDVVSVNSIMAALTKFKGGTLVNPLADMWTTKPMAEALARANHLRQGYFTKVIRGAEGAAAPEQSVSWLYRNLVLLPKATAQLAKTVFSLPTHLRNFLSAGAFAAANGVLFEGLLNPKLLGQSFRKGWQISGVGNIKNTRFNDPAFEKAYRELLELGIVNSQVQIGDLKNLLRDVKFGDKITDVDAVMRPMMARLKKIPEYLQGKYVAEDDFWKITNYFVELNRRDQAYRAKGIIKTANQLKEEAASIVRNTVPNYSYVGEYVKTARLLPVGNFMSFPSEMIRTTTNIADVAVTEMKHSRATIGSDIAPYVWDKELGRMVANDNPLWRIGAQRVAGMAFTLAAVPTGMVEGAKALYNVTEEEINALRQFVPEWSKYSTLIPIRDEETGNLKYIDFSHSNAYDLISRPFRTFANEIAASTKDGNTILAGFAAGAEDAVTELVSPFIDESIWTEAAADVNFSILPGRGGRTRDGRVLYTDQTPFGDKLYIKMRHLWKALEPGGFTQYGRIVNAANQKPSKTGEIYELDDQMLGLIGFRPITVDPLKSMGFKIAEYQRGIREARREFTGGFFGLLRGGPIKPNDIIERFYKSNKARFNVQQEMAKNINAAETLGESNTALRREFEDRQLTSKTFADLKRGKFEPYYPSADIRERFKEISKDLGDINMFKMVAPLLRNMYRDMKNVSLFDTLQLNLPDYLLEDIVTPPLPQAVTSAMPNETTISQGQAMEGAQANLLSSGLTPTEEAFLSEEEKIMKRKQRGVMA
jgi:hypothetical protein|tara:strand:- start:5227 stop:9198 length:3972 start_codon:yes stop_codon:yes gene_type:complete